MIKKNVDEEVNMDSTSTSAKRTDRSPTGTKRRPGQADVNATLLMEICLRSWI